MELHRLVIVAVIVNVKNWLAVYNCVYFKLATGQCLNRVKFRLLRFLVPRGGGVKR